MAPKRKHYQPIIDAAVTLFRKHGYSTTGINDIVELSQAPKGSLYYYFPGGKPAIAAAAVEEIGKRVIQTLSDLANKSPSTAELIFSHANLLAAWMKKSGFRDGCPMTTVLLELSPNHRLVNAAARKVYADRVKVLRDKLTEDGVVEPRATQLASLCTSAIQGALIEARVQRNEKPLLVAAKELSNLLA